MMSFRTSEPGDESSLSELLLWLSRMKLRLQAVRRDLERNEERVDNLLQDLIALESALVARGDSAVPMLPLGIQSLRAKPDSVKHKTDEVSAILESIAQPGADKLVIRPMVDGSALIQINGEKHFKLSPTLARLLEILADDSSYSDDNLVGWKTHAEIARWLEKKMGQQFSRHAVNQLVSRLRHELDTSSRLYRYFIQTHRRFGLRFALKSKTEA
jgi:hypothetical protein